MGIDHRGQKVVRRADRMDVAGEVEVDQLLRHHLRAAASGSATLDPEHRPEGRLAQAQDRVGAEPPEPVRERDRRGGLAFAELGRRHCRDADEPPVWSGREPVERAELDLRGRATVRLHFLGQETELCGEVADPISALWL
jgi:hypothetical protein